MDFMFGIPSKAFVGKDSSRQVGEILGGMDVKKVFCVYDGGVKDAGIVGGILKVIRSCDIDCVEFGEVVPNPPDTLVERGAAMAKKAHVDAIVAIGGGSAMDAGKAINILLTNPSPIHRYEGIDMVKNPVKPLVAIATTAGTGSEVTDFSIITDTANKKKMVIGGTHVGASIALVDPGLTVGLPPAVTAATGMDALTHAIEAYVSRAANVASDLNAAKAIEMIGGNLEQAVRDGRDMAARSDMLVGSMLAGFAFNSAVLGLAHAIAHPLGAHCGLPHGVANAIMLPHVIAFNASAVPEKMKDIARLLGQEVEGLDGESAAELATRRVSELNRNIGITGLKESGVPEDILGTIADEALKEGAYAFNPREASREEILGILNRAY